MIFCTTFRCIVTKTSWWLRIDVAEWIKCNILADWVLLFLPSQVGLVLQWRVSDTPGEAAPSHRPPDRWIDDFLLQERKNPPPIFTFLTFWNFWPARPLPGEEAERVFPALASSSITWTLSQCSYIPFNCFWELFWLYQQHNTQDQFAQITVYQKLPVTQPQDKQNM